MIGSIERSISLELKESGVQERIAVRQGDSLVHRIKISLTSGGKAYSLGGVLMAEVWALLPDGSTVTADCEVNGGTCIFVPGAGFFEAGGPVICRLILRGDDGAELFSPAFAFDTEGEIFGREAVEAQDFSRIGELLLQVLDIKRQCEEIAVAGGSADGEKITAAEEDHFILFSIEDNAYKRFTWESLVNSIGRYLDGSVSALSVKDPVSGYTAMLPELDGDSVIALTEDVRTLGSTLSSAIAEKEQLAPEFANDISECTDTSKLYVLPDGYIYAYKRIIYPGGVPQFTNQVDPSTANDTSPDTTLSGDEWLNGYRIATKAISERKGIVVTDLIPAKNGDVIRIKGFDTSANTAPSGSTAYGEFRVIALTSSGEAIATEIQPATPKATSATTGKLEQMDGAELENGIYCFNVSSSVFNVGTSNVTYLRVCGYPEGGNSDGVVVTVNEPIAYSEESESYQWTNTGHAFVPADYEDRIIGIEEDLTELSERIDELGSADGGTGSTGGTAFADDVDILLPASDVAVVGHEYNIYKNTVVFSSRPVEDYDIAVWLDDSSVQAYNYHEVWRFTPAKTGTYTLKMRVRDVKDHNTVYAEKTMALEVIEDSAVTGKKVLFLGDSLTAAGVYPNEIEKNLSEGGITSIGTVSVTRDNADMDFTVMCEGRSGWATWDYAGTKADSKTRFSSDSNVFRNPETNKFDMGYYMNKYHPNVKLDAVCLNLGTNGIGANTSTITGMNELIARIREYDATLPILIHIPIPVVGQDKYAGVASQSNNTSPYMRMRWYELARAYITNYEGKMEDVYLVPVYMNMDTEHDFPTETVAISSRNPAEITRVSNGHPNVYGYRKMADVYFAWLMKYMREE